MYKILYLIGLNYNMMNFGSSFNINYD